jgi:threonine/homoserine/homoserine lactone efflux protein
VIDPVTLLAFLPLSLALNLTPGADMMFSLAQGARGGARAGWAASGGIALGCLEHVTLAGAGLGVLLARHPAAFDLIRWAGAGYLAWLAWRTLTAPAGDGPAAVSPVRAFRDGLLGNLTNPKVILFILAFLPQFVNPAAPVLPQFLVLGALLAAGGCAVNGLVGTFSGAIGRALARSHRAGRAARWISAGLFGALAVRLVPERRA